MGGLLSPVLLDTGRISVDQPDAGHDQTDVHHFTKPDEIELMYDPHLNCFYDPVTCKYYELLQSDKLASFCCAILYPTCGYNGTLQKYVAIVSQSFVWRLTAAYLQNG